MYLLHENGTLSIDDPTSKHISESHFNILSIGGYDPNKILIKHCFNHTSGLFDFAVANDMYLNIAFKNSKKRWTKTEQLEGISKFATISHRHTISIQIIEPHLYAVVKCNIFTYFYPLK